LILNDYKTAKTFGAQEYDIDKKFSKIVRIFLKHNKSGYFITKTNRSQPISANGITKLLNRLFMRELDKKISTSMIRHITATHDRRNDKSLKELEELKKKVQKRYLHSVSTNHEYRKID
jgi:site-specific recombinase XerD